MDAAGAATWLDGLPSGNPFSTPPVTSSPAPADPSGPGTPVDPLPSADGETAADASPTVAAGTDPSAADGTALSWNPVAAEAEPPTDVTLVVETAPVSGPIALSASGAAIAIATADGSAGRAAALSPVWAPPVGAAGSATAKGRPMTSACVPARPGPPRGMTFAEAAEPWRASLADERRPALRAPWMRSRDGPSLLDTTQCWMSDTGIVRASPPGPAVHQKHTITQANKQEGELRLVGACHTVYTATHR